ncbi:MAG: NAD(P)/FAD-dependent oxidoreductase [Flavobacteriales bacterium]|nr:NAD(P)/FAD-dependent oxidoreductase [Flavobacteriales bacterium]
MSADLPPYEHFDLCVIGGGPSGYAAAMRAVDLGLRTLLVERDKVGGAGIYNGALSSKTLWEMSQRVANANDLVRKRDREPYRLSWEEINRTLNEAVFERKYLFSCHMQLLEKNSDCFRHARGMARFTGPNTIRIDRGDRHLHITADHIVVATGSRPRILPDMPVDEEVILSSDGIFRMDELPRSIVIVGAGVIGCEFATILSNFGCTQVHLVDRAARILPFEDEDVSEVVARSLERRGVIIHGSAKLESLKRIGSEAEFTLLQPDGTRHTERVDRALISVGRIPCLDGLGLELTGIHQRTGTSQPELNGTATSLSHIHVVGDATGSNMLVNLGEVAARHTVERIAGLTGPEPDTGHASTIMFLEPEVAGVGLNEQECRKQGIPHRVARIDYSCLARAIAMRRTKGFFKLLVTDDADMHVLGMRAVGEHASSAIQAVALMMRMGTGVRELADLIHPHPSITEGVQECARLLLGTSLFKAPVFGDRMRCATWRPNTSEASAA